MVDLCVSNRFCEVDLLQHITKLEGACIGAYFITLSWPFCLVISALCFFQLTKDFFQATFTYSLFGFWGNFYFPFTFIICYVSLVFKIVNKIAHAIFLAGHFVFPV